MQQVSRTGGAAGTPSTFTLAGTFGSFCALVVGGLLLFGAYAGVRFLEITVGGSYYGRIIQAHDANADLLPPPLFVVEPFADAQLALRNPQDLAAHKVRIGKLRAAFKDSLSRWRRADLPASVKAAITQDAVADAELFWTELEGNFLPALERNDLAAARTSIDKLTALFAKHQIQVDAAIAKVQQYGKETEQKVREETALLRAMFFTFGGLLLVVLAAAALIMRKMVIKPLQAIGSDMSRLAGGDVSSVSPVHSRIREVVQMSVALGSFRTAYVERSDLEIAARDHAQAQQAGIAATQAALGRVASGDLTTRITESIGAGFEQLKHDFNQTIERIEQTVLSVKSGSDGITVGTSEIAQAADDLSRRTENQAANLEEATAALSEITQSVRSSAETASDARKLVLTAKVEAEKSGEVMRRAIDAMHGIEEASKEINQITGVIDEIAFQTNLLALNAGVEAARAGDAGRGFAVVASEVRALAQRSAEAAKQIKVLIVGSTNQVDRGVELVGETGAALERIVKVVGDINVAIVKIAETSQEQSNSISQVNTAVGEMDTVTQQNAAMVEQTTAAARTLAERTAELGRLVASFRTVASAKDTALRGALQAAVPHAFEGRARAVPPSAQRGPRVVVSNAVEHSGRRRSMAAAGGAAAATAADSWKEF